MSVLAISVIWGPIFGWYNSNSTLWSVFSSTIQNRTVPFSPTVVKLEHCWGSQQTSWIGYSARELASSSWVLVFQTTTWGSLKSPISKIIEETEIKFYFFIFRGQNSVLIRKIKYSIQFYQNLWTLQYPYYHPQVYFFFLNLNMRIIMVCT